MKTSAQYHDLNDLLSAMSTRQPKTNLRFNIVERMNSLSMGKIAEKLKEGNCPEGLNIIFGNDLGAGTTILMDALKDKNCPKNITLQFVDNDIGKEGVEAIAKLIESAERPEE